LASGGIVYVRLLQWQRRSEDPTLKLRKATESMPRESSASTGPTFKGATIIVISNMFAATF
jgi:hypothetical protein